MKSSSGQRSEVFLELSPFNANSPNVKITLLLISSLTVMSGATIAPSLPAMTEYFASVDNAEFLVKLALTLPALFIAIGGPFVGLFVDRIGRKPLLVFSTLLFACAGTAGFFLNSLWAIIVSRALLGISVAGTMTGLTTITGDYYQGEQRASFMGLQAAFMGLGGVVFICLGGIIADINWRFPFLLYAIAIIFMLLTIVNLVEPKIEKIAKRGTPGKHPQSSGNGTLEPLDKSRPSAPRFKLPRQLLGTIYAIGGLYKMAYFLIPVQIPFYLKDLANSSPAESGLAIGASTLASAIAASQYGGLQKRLGYSGVVIASFALTAIGLFIISVGNSYQIVLVGLIIAGMGFGLMMPNLSVWVVSISPPPLRGRAIGGLTTSQFLGQFLSPTIAFPLSGIIGLGNTYFVTGALLLQAAATFLAIRVSTAFVAEKV